MGAHQIMSRLAGYAPVVWMNPTRDLRTALSGESSSGTPSETPGVTIYEHGLLLSHVWRVKALGDLTFNLRVRRAARILRKQGCTRIIAYLWRARFAPALDLDLFDHYVYHILDDYTFSESEQPISRQELRVIRTVDTVIVHSPGLEEKKGNINPNTLLIPNGVEYDRFSRPVEEPADLAPVPRPRIGYTGWVKKQLDWTLLEGLIDAHPEWHFVFVGGLSPHPEIESIVARVSTRSNAHFLGSKTSREMARYPQHFDCCIMPYRQNAYTDSIYPLKLHEYLASGQPVVGTEIRSLEPYRGLIELPGEMEQWEESIRRALNPEALDPQRVEARQEMARKHDWDLLVQRIAAALGLAAPRNVLTPTF